MRTGRIADMEGLLKEVRRHYGAHRRSHLPWRKTRDPYRILVSEIMLQQTQVERVVPFYTKFLKAFPTVRALGNAELSRVLSAWQGLGYNRRAKFLHQAAKDIVRRGRFPRRAEDIEQLPGVGHYTAGAVAAFAFNSPEVFIETNIRTVFIRFFFPKRKKVPDAELLPLVAQALKQSRMEPREFYAALMDYGSFLKRSGVKLNAKSAHYAKQSRFEGSARQLRGMILRELLKKPATVPQLMKNLSREREAVARELARLLREQLVIKKGVRFCIE